jgi:predicted nucleic acid-binding protein
VIVVDTNVICYRWMASAYSEAAERAWAKDPDWIAPLLWRSEFRSALAGALRKRLVAPEAAISIAEKAEAQFVGREFLVSARAVLGLVAASRCSAYDCEFIALAQKHQIVLVTQDRDVLREFSAVAKSLEEFLRV